GGDVPLPGRRQAGGRRRHRGRARRHPLPQRAGRDQDHHRRQRRVPRDLVRSGHVLAGSLDQRRQGHDAAGHAAPARLRRHAGSAAAVTTNTLLAAAPATAQSALHLNHVPATDDLAVHALHGETMGTRWRVCLAAGARVPLPPLHDAVQATIDRVVAQMSTWEADSDISRYNRAEAGSWQALPQPFFDVLRCALRIAEASGGACDPTIAPLVDLWGFGAGSRGHRVPDAAEIDAARARTGWRRIELRDDARTALQPGNVALDLSAIAKGHGVDAVVARLREHGIAGALVDVGGELAGYGRKP